jgi:hypothetical protein
MGDERQDVLGQDGYRFLTPESEQRLDETMERVVREGERVLRSMPLLARSRHGAAHPGALC